MRGCVANKVFYRVSTPLSVLLLGAMVSVSLSEWARPAWRVRRVVDPEAKRHVYKSAPLVPVPAYFLCWRKNYLTANREIDRLGLVRGIFLGDDSQIPDEVRETFREAGLSHLLAASGYNCWIVAMVFALVFQLLLQVAAPLLPSLTNLLLKKYSAPVSKLLGAWLFWLWTDQSPPITRSVAMISGIFVFELLEVPVPFGRFLVVQYLCSLIVLPRLWHNASFQLTFGCLFGLVLFPPLVERFRSRWWSEGFRAKVWDYMVTGFGACLGTIPTSWIIFDQANFTSLLTNWFAIPPVSFILMPLGLVQILLLAPGAPWSAWSQFFLLIQGMSWIGAKTAGALSSLIHLWVTHLPVLIIYK
jgi:ComEC/Rec2-related protein